MKNEQCYKVIWIVRVLLLLACMQSFLHGAERPNVVFILSDDQGWSDYSFMGHPHIKTPNIDRLAAQGILYERGYVTAPLCRPSLASIVTGLYPHQLEIRGNDPVGWWQTKNPEAKAELRNRMTAAFAKRTSFIKELQSYGYATLQTGKWWEGNPLDHGFDQAMTHGDPLRGGRHGDDGLKIGRETLQPIFDFTEQAVANGKPFFIWYGVFLPHTPHNAPSRLFEKYRDLAPNEPTAWYWANCEWLDETCGQLVTHLEQLEIYDDTIIIYTCDNGWIQHPERRNRFADRSKQEPYEKGIRTPIFITQTGTIKPYRDRRTLASNIDIAPTILKACGIEVPEEMVGLDLRSPEKLEQRDRVFVDAYEHDSDLDQLDDPTHGLKARVVIDGWDKLISFPNRVELYGLRDDPHEQNELSKQNPDTVARLEEILNGYWDQ